MRLILFTATIDRLLAIDPPFSLSTVVESKIDKNNNSSFIHRSFSVVETSVINEEIACARAHDDIEGKFWRKKN